MGLLSKGSKIGHTESKSIKMALACLILLVIFGSKVTARTSDSGLYHNHGHFHKHHSRENSPSVTDVIVPGPTVVVYEFEGKFVPLDQVCLGIKNGTFDWAPGTKDAPDCSSSALGSNDSSIVSASTVHPESASFSSSKDAKSSTTITEQNNKVGPSSASSPVFTSSSSSTIAQPELPLSSGVADSIGSTGLSGYDLQIAFNSNVTKEFPDGELDCGTFPSGYGAVPVNWVGLGGWSGIQYTTIQHNAVSHVDTAIAGNDCTNSDGGTTVYCSYACPAGYQKSQWPVVQGSANMAVSIGGLKCGSDGKLHLTNPSLSRYLCIQGTGQVSVQNDLSAADAICRTDYPGTEDETIPMVVQQSQSSQLTCPDASTYYKHLGMATTAEYYVNMKGVSVNDACTWNSDGSSEGNWAPIVFGVGMDENGKTWLSVQSTIQNHPSPYKDLDFTVELKGDFGGAACFYTNGYYCSSGGPESYNQADCQTIQSASVPGCTVELLSGNAVYVLTD